MTPLDPMRILRDVAPAVPLAAGLGVLLGGASLALGATVVSLVVLANLALWARLSAAYVHAAASDQGDPMVMAAMVFKSLLTVPVFLLLTWAFGAQAVGLGLGLPLVGLALRAIVHALSLPVQPVTEGLDR